MESPLRKSAEGVQLTSSSSSVMITNLPSPILMDILCRVPIKTLAACKRVCKSWLHLIKDPHFFQLHQSRAPTEVCFQFNHHDYTTRLYMGSFSFLNNGDPLDPKHSTVFELIRLNNGDPLDVKLSALFNSNSVKGKLYLANTCNGLLCYCGSNSNSNMFAVVWNPCTSEFITFPAPKTVNDICTCRGYGLGFSTKANKYKLLRVMRTEDTKKLVADICTIEKGCSWKTVGPLPCSSYPFYSTFLRGTLHWLLKYSNMSEFSILTFDFGDDQFGRVPLPPYYGCKSDTDLWRENLGVLGGCLFITDYTNEGVSIWLMKEYGVQASWTKLFYLGFTIEKKLNIEYSLPISYMDNGEILMKSPFYVFSYNPDLKLVRIIGKCPSSFRVTAFRPSLALLKDSMLGYEVHVKPMCADLEHVKMSTIHGLWKVKPVKEYPHQNVSKEVLEELRKERKQRQELEERLRNELAPLKEQTEQLKQQNQLLEERLQHEHAKVKQLEEQIQHSQKLKQEDRQMIMQMMDEMRARLCGSH